MGRGDAGAEEGRVWGGGVPLPNRSEIWGGGCAPPQKIFIVLAQNSAFWHLF